MVSMATTVNSVTFYTFVIIVIWVFSDISGESGDKLVYAAVVWLAQKYVAENYIFVCGI
jgi:hypothetical protein